MSQKRFAPVTIETAAPGLPAAAEILRDYLSEMISRYYGRPTDDVAGELAKLGSDGYRPLRAPAPDAITGDS